MPLPTILGHERALGQLRSALAADRLHHGLIFHGPVGVGKGTVAWWLAAVLLCLERVAGEVEPCGVCASCRLFEREAGGDEEAGGKGGPGERPENPDGLPAGLTTPHPDFHWVAKEWIRFAADKQLRTRKMRSIPVEVIRERLLEPAGRTPRVGRSKVFVVDEAELLNASSQNVMLKTLEEPPAGTTIVLITASEETLLPTIRSRCQRVGFGPLDDAAVRAWLDGRPDTAELSQHQLNWLVGFAGGSIGLAVHALEMGLISWAEAVRPRIHRAVGGTPQPDLGSVMADLIKVYASAWEKRFKQASKEAANQRGAGLMGLLLGVEARRGVRRALAGEADAGSLQGWLTVIDAVQAFEARLGANVNLAMACAGLGASVSAALTGATLPAVPLAYPNRLLGV